MLGAMRIAALLLVVIASHAAAQGQSVVEGSVVSPTGEPLGYSTVEIAGADARFTSDAGHFTFTAPQPGRYGIRLKHLGFAVLDTAVTVTGPGKIAVRFTLQPIAIHLATVQVREKNKCGAARTPGSDLYIALEELRKNAERDRILRNSYPFIYKLARRYDSFSQGGNAVPVAKQDTVAFESTTRNDYRPGDIFQPAERGSNATREVRIPSLSDLADEAFLRNHCFSFGGVENVGDFVAYRLDFRPAPNISNPDFEGSAFLDTATYMIRRIEFKITHPERAHVSALSVRTIFKELFPGVALFYTVHGVQPMGKYDLVEDQKLVEVNFLRGSPFQSPQSKVNQ